MTYRSIVGTLIVSMVCVAPLAAQEQRPSAQELKQANNPLADMKAFNLQNYYVPRLYGLPDEVANTFWLRYAAPVGRVLVRASLPFNTVPVGGGDPVNGMGDFNIFGAYLFSPPTASTQFGVGPLLSIPTASEEALGTGKWHLGAAGVVFASPTPQIQTGGLITIQTSFAGDDDRDRTAVLAVQPFGFWQLGGGLYLRTAPIWAFNLETREYHVPFGVGAGKVLRVGKTVFNMFLEPQFTILHDGVGQPGVQFFTGLNMQFLN